MGKNRLFIPQDTLDLWVDEEKAFVEGDELTLAEDGRIYRLAAAVRFLREATGANDPNELVGKVKEETKLAILGADAYMDLVILEENAYDVQRGFVGVPALEASHEDELKSKAERASQMPVEVANPAATQENDSAAAPPKPADNEDEEDDQLAKFLLKSLK